MVTADEVAEIQSFDELPIFADPREYEWETDNEGDCQEAEESDNHLMLLQKHMSTEANTTARTKTTLSGADTPSQAISQAEQSAPVPTESPRIRRVFTLSDVLRECTLQNGLQELYKKIRKPVKERIPSDDNLAVAIAHYDACTKTRKAVNKVARQYMGIRPMPEARVQALNEEIHFTDARKLAENGFF